MINLSIFAERLDELIFENNLTQKQLAESTGVDVASVCRYLGGGCEPSLKALIAIADYFKCSTDFLLGLESENKSHSFLPCGKFSDRVDVLIKQKGLTRYAFCKSAEISDSRFYDWRNGKHEPTVSSIVKIAKFLDCSVDYVLGREV
ncbi:MAG: helix-turn-helix domain-containing protein [Clostridia bacterium]|nr:helix-turn-helix domain-containing protein [Clostridia bacterium]